MTNPAVPAKEDPSGSGGVRAVLVLSAPPAPYGLDSWYWNPISGVPFLLLNLLGLQRGGVTHITLFHPEIRDISRTRREALAADPRLTATLHWESDPAGLRETLAHPDCRLVAHGDALHSRLEVAAALAGMAGTEAPVLPGPDKTIKTLLNQLDADTASGFERDRLRWLPGHPDWRVADRRDFRRLSNQRLQTCGLSNDSLLDRWVTRHISRQITRVFLRTPLTPNQITLIALGVGLAGAGCFLMGGYAAGVGGAVLIQISAWIDCSDGEVARLRFQETPLGGTLDIWADNLVHAAAFFSLGMGLYFSTEQGIYKILGSLAVVGTLVSFALLQSTVVESKNRAAKGDTGSAGTHAVDHLANRDFTYVLFTLALIDQLPLFLFLTAIGSNIFAAWLGYLRLRTSWHTSANWCSKNSK